eukprot:6438091-Alexandrium_andersonii.AAC.1
MPCCGRDRSGRATRGAASPHPKLPGQHVVADSAAHVARWLREGLHEPLLSPPYGASRPRAW